MEVLTKRVLDFRGEGDEWGEGDEGVHLAFVDRNGKPHFIDDFACSDRNIPRAGAFSMSKKNNGEILSNLGQHIMQEAWEENEKTESTLWGRVIYIYIITYVHFHTPKHSC